MPNLIVAPERARRILADIPHRKCRNAIDRYWRVEGRHVKPQSVCWLFCWGKTGITSEKAKVAAQEAFDRIFDVSFMEVDRRLGPDGHTWARHARYSRLDREVETQLDSYLNR